MAHRNHRVVIFGCVISRLLNELLRLSAWDAVLRDTYQLELADLSLEVGDFPKIFIYNSKSHKSNLIYAL